MIFFFTWFKKNDVCLTHSRLLSDGVARDPKKVLLADDTE